MAAIRSTTALRQARGTRAPRRPKAIVYPDSDGKPMGETDLHREEMWRLIHLLHEFFAAHPTIYVSGNLILYYEEGNPRVSVVPDVMVIKEVPAHWRETYLLWQEGKAPCFVIEVTSKTTRTVDEHRKRDLYARLGVQEYILYDPRFPGLETQRPPLRGYRLTPTGYEPMEPSFDGSLLSDELGLRLVLEDRLLRCYDRRTGERLLSREERAEQIAERAEQIAERAEQIAERAEQAAQREATRAREAERRAVAAQQQAAARIAELERLLREQRQSEP